MKLKPNIVLLALSVIFLGTYSGQVLSEDHKHEEEKTNSKEKHDDHEEHDDQGKNDGHEEHGGHDDHGKEDSHSKKGAKGDSHEESEAPKNVGPNKGIVLFDEREGFVLSKEATKNFEIEVMTLQGVSPWTLPKAALVMTRDDMSVFRSRNGKLLRVDVKVNSKTSTHAQISSKDLNVGDQVVVRGAPFLRVAELDVTSGESGHHH